MIYTTEKYDLEKATPGSAGYDLRFLEIGRAHV